MKLVFLLLLMAIAVVSMLPFYLDVAGHAP